VDELTALGYRDHPVDLAPTPVGTIDRDDAVGTVLTRLAAGRSAWNAADIRGEAERLIAAEGVVAEAAVRSELAEDLTARALHYCLPLLQREGVPEHVRTWTSPAVLEVEADLTARLAARSSHHGPAADLRPDLAAALERLDAGQTATAAALAGNQPLVVVEGAAGAGKTTTLATTRHLLARQGLGLVMVTPTLKAAKVASAEVGTAAGSAAWLAFQHGWRWNDDGAWTRLTAGQADQATGAVYAGPAEEARLLPGDLLVVDEAGMLDQDTARALLTVADECGARVALLGDRHQLAAVGRGGVLDLALRATDPAAHLTLDTVHRFIHTDDAGRTVPDTDYAELTLAMRRGQDPKAVFDALCARGQIRLHRDPAALQETLAAIATTAYTEGQELAVVVDTREQAAELNAAIRDRLVADSRVDDTRTATTRAGQRIGAGYRIATRRNDRTLGVANRDTWTVTAVGPDGELIVTPSGTVPGHVTPGVTPTDAAGRVLPAGYVTSHVELAYASTAHGVQGDTVATAHMVIDERTGAAAAYVGMTRGRTANTAHLIAVDLAEAREHWVAVFGRDRADLGPSHAAELAAAEAARYALPRPVDEVLAGLQEAWTAEQRCLDRLTVQESLRDRLRTVVALEAGQADRLEALEAGHRQAAADAEHARQQAEVSGAIVTAEADRIRDALLARWDAERTAAREAARTVLAGPGRLGLRRATVARAGQQLIDWADRWRPHLPELPADTHHIAQVAGWFDDRPAIWGAFDTVARRAAEGAHPEYAALRAAVHAAQHAHEQIRQALAEARRQRDEQLAGFGAVAWTPDLASRLADLDRNIAADQRELGAARARIAQLQAEPTLAAQPADRLAAERDAWRIAHRRPFQSIPRRSAPAEAGIGGPQLRHELPTSSRGVGPSLGR
jgi:exodeoxyribonuclease V alpha subunit